MEEFDLFESILRDALLSDCRRYSILSLHKVQDTESRRHYSREVLKGLKVVKLFDHTNKRLIDTIVRKSEKGREFIEVGGDVRLLEDFKHPSGKDLMTRVIKGIHEAACNNRGYRDNLEIICSRYTHEYLRRELMCRMTFNPFEHPDGIIQLYGCKVRIAEQEIIEDFIVTSIYKH